VVGGRCSGREEFLLYSHEASSTRACGQSIGLVVHCPSVEIRPVVCRGLNAVATDGEYHVNEIYEGMSLMTKSNRREN
jgi:hypothetical protein